jgi:hypothetical protein
MMKTFLTAGIASSVAFSHTARAATTTLGSLLGGGSLTGDDLTRDVMFSKFLLTDNTPTPAAPGDFIPDPGLADVALLPRCKRI